MTRDTTGPATHAQKYALRHLFFGWTRNFEAADREIAGYEQQIGRRMTEGDAETLLETLRKKASNPHADAIAAKATRIPADVYAPPAKPGEARMTERQAHYLRDLGDKVTPNGQENLRKLELIHGGSLSLSQAGVYITELKRLAGEIETNAPDGTAHTNAPDGYYYVDGPDGPGCYLKTHPTDGKFAGWTFIKRVPIIEGHESYHVRGEEAVRIIKAIDENPTWAALQYGRITHRCPSCNRPLRDQASQQAGIGPECRNKYP